MSGQCAAAARYGARCGQDKLQKRDICFLNLGNIKRQPGIGRDSRKQAFAKGGGMLHGAFSGNGENEFSGVLELGQLHSISR